MYRTIVAHYEAKVIPSRGHRTGGRSGGISSAVSISDINGRLGFRAQHGKSSDGKSTRTWTFSVDGNECAIWDYKGHRWSTSGPKWVFEALFGNDYERDVYPGSTRIEKLDVPA